MEFGLHLKFKMLTDNEVFPINLEGFLLFGNHIFFRKETKN